MKRSLLATLTLAANLGTTTVQAQDASQWAGAYGGLHIGTANGDHLYDDGGSYKTDGNGYGLMLGYNYATGNWVLGGELAYTKSTFGEPKPNDDYAFTSLVDLKARAGYTMGNALYYGTLGATLSEWQEGEGDGGYNGNGLLYGVGVEYLAGPRYFVGAELLVRDITTDWNAAGDEMNADFTTFTLRAGMKF